ncbi:hypothetical protein BDW62DRAFT_202545 [Aspergillus aurantiobrunneus]
MYSHLPAHAISTATSSGSNLVLASAVSFVLDGASYQQLAEKTVRVRGAQFIPSTVYQVKLEGVDKLGYRTIFIGGIRDPILIRQFDGKTGFATRDCTCATDVPAEYSEMRETGFGVMIAVKHLASIEMLHVGWDIMPELLGSDEKKWL